MIRHIINSSKIVATLLLAMFAFSCSHTPEMLKVPDMDFSKDFEPVKLELDSGATEFNILQIADFQTRSADDGTFEVRAKLIEDLVKKSNPDLIVLTGDNTEGSSGKAVLKKLIQFLDGLNVPYASVFGNHDAEAGLNSILAKYYEEGKNSLFKKGPLKIHGVGNYVVNLMQGETIKYSFYMLDSNRYRFYSSKDKKESVWGGSSSTEYDYIYPDQIAWYKYNVDKINELNGSPVDSLAFFHIALPEFRAYDEAKLPAEDIILKQSGEIETICNPWVNTGLFDVMKELGSTKGVFVGHDHLNNFVFKYQGIILGYGAKTGDGNYHHDEYQGGTLITLKNDFKDVEVKHIFLKDLK